MIILIVLWWYRHTISFIQIKVCNIQVFIIYFKFDEIVKASLCIQQFCFHQRWYNFNLSVVICQLLWSLSTTLICVIRFEQLCMKYAMKRVKSQKVDVTLQNPIGNMNSCIVIVINSELSDW